MKNKWKSILSLTAIGAFLFIALASLGPDASTNTTVAIKDCEEKPAMAVQLKIDVYYRWQKGNTIPGAFGNISIVHQKVNPDETCTFYIESTQVIDFVCGSDGEFSYIGPIWTHDNSEDLIRVELYGKGSVIDGYGAVREVKVQKYSSGYFSFYIEVDEIL